MKKKFLVGGCRFFVSEVISGGLWGHLGPLHLTLNQHTMTISIVKHDLKTDISAYKNKNRAEYHK